MEGKKKGLEEGNLLLQPKIKTKKAKGAALTANDQFFYLTFFVFFFFSFFVSPSHHHHRHRFQMLRRGAAVLLRRGARSFADDAAAAAATSASASDASGEISRRTFLEKFAPLVSSTTAPPSFPTDFLPKEAAEDATAATAGVPDKLKFSFYLPHGQPVDRQPVREWVFLFLFFFCGGRRRRPRWFLFFFFFLIGWPVCDLWRHSIT